MASWLWGMGTVPEGARPGLAWPCTDALQSAGQPCPTAALCGQTGLRSTHSVKSRMILTVGRVPRAAHCTPAPSAGAVAAQPPEEKPVGVGTAETRQIAEPGAEHGGAGLQGRAASWPEACPVVTGEFCSSVQASLGGRLRPSLPWAPTPPSALCSAPVQQEDPSHLTRILSS